MEIGQKNDEQWMRIAIAEAAKGRGHVEPNPMVGCVVVRDGVVIASGHHSKFGGPHAEVDAMQSVDCSGATIYVTLEPCSHHGKTPPCAPFVVSKKPSRVVIAMTDPFPEVAGRGIECLRDNGIQTTLGVLEAEARELNAPYLKLLETQMPWTIAKWAMTLDGAIATSTGESKWISNDRSREAVHRMRGCLDAIIVGINTALVDNPELTARLPNAESPPRVARRVILDHHGRLPLDSNLVQTISEAPLWVVVGHECSDSKLNALSKAGAVVHSVPKDDQRDTLSYALEALGRERATNVLIEGGGALLGSAFDLEVVDQIECFIAPKIFGGDVRRPIYGSGVSHIQDANKWRLVSTQKHDDDVQLSFRRL